MECSAEAWWEVDSAKGSPGVVRECPSPDDSDVLIFNVVSVTI